MGSKCDRGEISDLDKRNYEKYEYDDQEFVNIKEFEIENNELEELIDGVDKDEI